MCVSHVTCRGVATYALTTNKITSSHCLCCSQKTFSASYLIFLHGKKCDLIKLCRLKQYFIIKTAGNLSIKTILMVCLPVAKVYMVCSSTARHKVVLVSHVITLNRTPAVWENHSFSRGDGPLLRDEGLCWLS